MSAHHAASRGTGRGARSTAPPNRANKDAALHRYPPLPATVAHNVHHQQQHQREGNRTMLDRTQVDAVIFRVAIATFTYYPNKHIKEPGYTLDEDLGWCMRPLRHLSQDERNNMRAKILHLITDPSADRQAFIEHLKSLSADT